MEHVLTLKEEKFSIIENLSFSFLFEGSKTNKSWVAFERGLMFF